MARWKESHAICIIADLFLLQLGAEVFKLIIEYWEDEVFLCFISPKQQTIRSNLMQAMDFVGTDEYKELDDYLVGLKDLIDAA
jgi:hypothetical protein